MLFGKDLYQQIPLGDFPPPALPSLSPQVFSRAFTHSSKAGVVQSKRALRYSSQHNDSLEFVGDALLYSIVANYLYHTFPHLRVSYLSAIRQRIVQNTTLAKFATLYKMDQALDLGEGSEYLRNDTKVRADTFEAFVGAVAEVHGHELTRKWIEELIKPYCQQLYEHHARSLGESLEVDGTPADQRPVIDIKKRRYRLCGWLPLPFLWLNPETKSITSSPSSVSQANYGTLVSTSEAAASTRKDGYTRLNDSTASRGSGGGGGGGITSGDESGPSLASAMKKNKSTDNVAAFKRNKSRDRVAFTPPAVSNLERIQAGKGTAPGQQTRTNSAPQPKSNATVTLPSGWEVPATAAVQSDGETSGWDSNAELTTRRKKSNKTPAATGQNVAVACVPAAASVIAVQHPPTKSTAPTSNGSTSATGPPAISAPRQEPQTPAKPGAKVLSNATSDEPAAQQSQRLAGYLSALKSARSDPVAFLERHPMFHGRKAKSLAFDDSLSTPNKAVVRVKIDGQGVTQSAAAGTDKKLAKARAAFKAIETLHLLPDLPSEGMQSNGLSGAPVSTGTPVKTGSNGTPFTQHVGFPIAAAIGQQTPAGKANPALATGPLPPAIYSSLPTPGKVSAKTQYFVTSVKGFSSGTYYAILNADHKLIGQAHALKKADAIATAEDQAKAGKVQTQLTWSFEENSSDMVEVLKRLSVLRKNRDATGPLPMLTHAFAVDAKDKARLAWLEWFSDDKSMWKCAILIDGSFCGSAKHAERKQAVSLAGQSALDELEQASAGTTSK